MLLLGVCTCSFRSLTGSSGTVTVYICQTHAPSFNCLLPPQSVLAVFDLMPADLQVKYDNKGYASGGLGQYLLEIELGHADLLFTGRHGVVHLPKDDQVIGCNLLENGVLRIVVHL